ncbi:spore coat protein [Neobacillus muris]|uniref:spore coat protein n=1 Tax=Neobacillus muris TaxID=2941334 RepID=UPI00203C3B37|nr:spore coat protein [Neobacillus muris]
MTEKKWRALDHCDDNSNNSNADVAQDANQLAITKQQSFEWIVVRDSEDVQVHTTDTQVAISLQLALQVAIAIVITITIGDSERADQVVQDLKQFFQLKQRNSQKTVVLGSKHVNVTTTDTQVAVNIQALLQILVAIVARIDVL